MTDLREPRVTAILEGLVKDVALPDFGRIFVGREKDCELCVDRASILPRHLSIAVSHEITLENLGGKGAVTIDGRPLDRGERVVLTRRAWVTFGEAALQLRGRRREFAFVRMPDSSGEEPLAPPLSETLERAKVAATGRSCLMIVGETGVGKEALARQIHQTSDRAKSPFLRVNCASLNEAQADAQLFGYESGAFLGAEEARAGLLEAAHGGVLLLNEVGELALPLQDKLFRALIQGSVQRLGGEEERRIEVRVVTTTDRDLEVLVQGGTFRKELYCLLSAEILELPPLRQRLRELLDLAHDLLVEQAGKSGVAVPELAPETERLLLEYSWPGNIRELRSVIERAVLLADRGIVLPEHCALSERTISIAPPYGFSSVPPPHEAAVQLPRIPDMPAAPDVLPGGLKDEMRELEKKRIMDAIDECGGNQTKAARMLGISRRALLHRLDSYGLPRPRKTSTPTKR